MKFSEKVKDSDFEKFVVKFNYLKENFKYQKLKEI